MKIKKAYIGVGENKVHEIHIKPFEVTGAISESIIEDIRADIETLKLDTMYKYVGDFRYGVDTVVAIIDKHMKGANE